MTGFGQTGGVSTCFPVRERLPKVLTMQNLLKISANHFYTLVLLVLLIHEGIEWTTLYEFEPGDRATSREQ